MPSLGSRVAQQLLLQLQSCLSPQAENPRAVSPLGGLLQRGGKRTLKEGDGRVMITEGWLRAIKAGNTVNGFQPVSASEQHYP